ncbi:ATP-binding protein [Novosphingobium sp.]|uniref:ATP-binding protein n=1 Tax=Novosphingobium sp. TaxID=1874826 RepID=UPI0025D7A099|nr:ATP-binding protein [Novosphingobium sp.]
MITVCFHGAESTGKSVLAARLAEELDCPWVAEYGRTYCEERGTSLVMDDLLAIARGEQDAIDSARSTAPDLLILDTDQLMTAAWAQKLFGCVPDELMSYPRADLYFLFEADVPWLDDGTRFFGEASERAEFAALAEHVLVSANVPFCRIGGTWEQRASTARHMLDQVTSGNDPVISSPGTCR